MPFFKFSDESKRSILAKTCVNRLFLFMFDIAEKIFDISLQYNQLTHVFAKIKSGRET